MQHRISLSATACTALAAAFLLASPGTAPAAETGGGAAPATGPGKPGPVRFEAVPGSDARRIILEPKAVERLGLETAKVTEGSIVRTQMVGGLVVPPLQDPAPTLSGAGGGGSGGGSFGQVLASLRTPVPTAPVPGQAAMPADGKAWILVTLSAAEWERVATGAPARVTPLSAHGKPGTEVLAVPTDRPPHEDMKRSMLTFYYAVENGHGLEPYSRVRVALQLAGSGEKRTLVPYGAIHYDPRGVPWVYVTDQPRQYQRQKVTVERIVGDTAILSQGPPVGAQVVSVGAPMLHGAEVFGK